MYGSPVLLSGVACLALSDVEIAIIDLINILKGYSPKHAEASPENTAVCCSLFRRESAWHCYCSLAHAQSVWYGSAAVRGAAANSCRKYSDKSQVVFQIMVLACP